MNTRVLKQARIRIIEARQSGGEAKTVFTWKKGQFWSPYGILEAPEWMLILTPHKVQLWQESTMNRGRGWFTSVNMYTGLVCVCVCAYDFNTSRCTSGQQDNKSLLLAQLRFLWAWMLRVVTVLCRHRGDTQAMLFHCANISIAVACQHGNRPSLPCPAVFNNCGSFKIFWMNQSLK